MPDAASAERCLRRLYFQQAYEDAVRAGPQLLRRFPQSAQLRAWLAANLSADLQEDSALALANATQALWPRSAWSAFARAIPLWWLGRAQEAVKEAAKARALAPDNPDMWWLEAKALGRADRPAQRIALVDSASARFGPSPEMLVLKWEGMMQQVFSHGPPDSGSIARAGAILEEALRLDSSSVSVLQACGRHYSGFGDPAAAARVDSQAAAAAPRSIPANAGWWRSFGPALQLTPAQRRDSALARAADFRRRYGDSPDLQLELARLYGGLGVDSLRVAGEGQLLREHPGSVQAERLLFERPAYLNYRIFGRKVADTLQAKTALRRMLREYLALPRHRRSVDLETAYGMYFESIRRDRAVSRQELVRTIRGMQRQAAADPSVTHAQAAVTLADRGVALDLAERSAMLAPALIRKHLQQQRESFETAGEYADTLSGRLAEAYDALGWVYFKEGRVPDARRQLAQALSLRPDFALALYHGARLAESRGDATAALDLYARGYVFERAAPVHLNEMALARIYAARNGSSEGYATFLEKLQADERSHRRARVLAQRLTRARSLPRFQLARLDGGTFSTDSLHGRVAFLNFWGTWCGGCLRELPQIQALHQKYRSDPDVVVITLDVSDPELDPVRRFMADRKLTFPVLVDDGYALKSGVGTYPTTWFVGRDGRVGYEQVGPSDDFLEEASWRIEALKSGAGNGPSH